MPITFKNVNYHEGYRSDMCQQIRWQRNPPRIPHSWAITALARPPEKVKKASPNLTGERAVLRLRLHAAGTKKSPAGQGPRGAGWQRPTLPPVAGSTIGAGGLNCSVRDGKRWGPAAVAAMPRTRHGRGRAAARQGEGGREGRGIGPGPPAAAAPPRRPPRGPREALGPLVPVGPGVAAAPPPAYPRGRLPRP